MTLEIAMAYHISTTLQVVEHANRLQLLLPQLGILIAYFVEKAQLSEFLIVKFSKTPLNWCVGMQASRQIEQNTFQIIYRCNLDKLYFGQVEILEYLKNGPQNSFWDTKL